MTNQAAQTMPEPVTASMCPSSDYAKGWNDCLAALSQTAGVPDRGRVCKWHQQDEGYDTFSTGCGHEYTVNDCTDGNVQLPYCPFCAKPLRGIAWNEDDDVSLSEALSSSAAAPAASGGECPAGVECARTNPELHRCKREAEAQFPAASVSERAREIVPVGPDGGWCTRCGCGNDAANFAHLPSCNAKTPDAAARAREILIGLNQGFIGCKRDNEIITKGNAYDVFVRGDTALRAIEQALTQQRGECEASVSVKQKWPKRHQFPKPDEHGNETGSIGEHAYAEGWNACLDEAKRMSGVPMPLKGKKGVVVVEDTTPQPSADAVWEYVTELRAQADQKMGVAGACAHDGDRARYKSAAQLLRRVADELESLLSAASGEGVKRG